MHYSKESPAGTGHSNVVYLGGLNTSNIRLKPPKRQALGDREYEYLYSLLCTMQDAIVANYLWDLVGRDRAGGLYQ